MFTKKALEKYKMATELQLEGLKLIKQSMDLMDSAQAAEKVVGDPANVDVMQGGPGGVPGSTQEGAEIILALPEEVRTACLETLDKVARELSASQVEEQLKMALQLDDISSNIQRNAFVYEKDRVAPEQEIKDFFEKGHQVHEGGKNLPDAGMFKTDISHEVASMVKNPVPYQKL